ncbi:hypothetical protein CRYUN_Cryun04dG0025200 [Craigia yunnanensis]
MLKLSTPENENQDSLRQVEFEPKDASQNSDESKPESDDTLNEVEESSPEIFQQPESIATSRPKRHIQKLARIARTWQKMAASGRKRIGSSRTNQKMAGANRYNKSSVVDKGHFVIYTTDKKRFVIPLAYLSNSIFVVLLKMSEKEFGLPSDRPIRLPCDSVVMNYIVSQRQRGLAKDLEKAVVNSVANYRCSSNTYFHQGHADQQSLVCGF